MTESSFSNFFGNQSLLHLTLKGHERTIKQAGQTIQKTAGGVLSPLVDYIDENQNVFTGNVAQEINDDNIKCLQIGLTLQAEDKRVNGNAPKFDISF